MQSVLLAIGCMFFVVGSTLEYSKHSEMVITGIILAMGMIKTYVGYLIFNIFVDRLHVSNSAL
jgi:hypothetical protein